MDVHLEFANFFDDDNEIKSYAYLLSKKISEGHICINLEDKSKYVDDLKELDLETFGLDKELLKDNKLVGSSEKDIKPFIIDGDLLYLRRHFIFEKEIADKINILINKSDETIEERKSFISENKDFINENLKSEGKDNTDWQLIATLNSFLNNFQIITGGPGTGKTTTIAKVLGLLYKDNKDLKIALTAPTGKASMRVKESLNSNELLEKLKIKETVESIKSTTIHRLLGYKHNSPYFKHNKNNPLNFDVIIVDEASMIDVALFYKLVDAIKPTSRLIILGDKNQLSSVEAGSLFSDLCSVLDNNNTFTTDRKDVLNKYISVDKQLGNNSTEDNNLTYLIDHITELEVSYRFTSVSQIGIVSKAVIENEVAIIQEYISNNEQGSEVIFDTEYKDEHLNNFAEKYLEYIDEPDNKKALEKLNEVKILCAIKESKRGVKYLNLKIEKYLQKKGAIKPFSEFYEHRPVLITKNYKDLNLYNGDIGILRKNNIGDLKAFFLDDSNNLRSISPWLIPEAETSFAMTIHKSQGSEYNNVLIVLPEEDKHALLTRELLYTAITRAKEKVVIQATEEVVLSTINKRIERISGINSRLKNL